MPGRPTRLLFAALFLVAACATRRAERRRPRSERRGPVELTVRGLPDPATHYEEQRARPWREETPLDRIVRDIVAEVARSSGTDAPQIDDRLSATAQMLAYGVHGRNPPATRLQLYARSQTGVPEPITELSYLTVPGQFFVEGDMNELREHVREVVGRSKLTHFGVGVKEGLASQVTIMMVFSRRAIRLEPFPTVIETGRSQELAFALDEPFADPTVYVAEYDGAVRTAKLSASEGRYTTTFTCPAEPGFHLVEVFGSDSFGPRILANVVVGCGRSHPSEVRVAIDREGGPFEVAAVEAELLALVNEERRKHGVPPVTAHGKAASVARGHSLDMADNKFFGHISPNTGSPGDRAEKAGVVASSVGENIALASSVANVHDGLMASPGHRKLILDPAMKHLGVGAVVRKSGRGYSIWATELFTSPVPVSVTEPAPETAPSPVPAPKTPPAPAGSSAVRIVRKRDGLLDCKTLGLRSAAATDAARAALLGEAKKRGADTVFLVERTKKGARRLTAEYYRCAP